MHLVIIIVIIMICIRIHQKLSLLCNGEKKEVLLREENWEKPSVMMF